jgi:phosphoribosyl-AMP cyclohydrolase
MLFHLNETVYFGVVLTKTTLFWSTKVKQIMSNDVSSGAVHHLQPLYLNSYSSDCFSEAFNASFLNQTKQTIHRRLTLFITFNLCT